MDYRIFNFKNAQNFDSSLVILIGIMHFSAQQTHPADDFTSLQSWLNQGNTQAHTHKHTCTHEHHHHHQSLNREGPWGTRDDFATSFLHFSLFSTALWDLLNSMLVCSLMLSSHLFLCLPCLLPPFTVPCKMVLARPDEKET